MASYFFPDIQGDVASVFLSYFKRAPEFEAMQHYVGVYEALQADPATAGNSFNLLAAHIYADGVASQEVPDGPTVTDSWYVGYLYSNILGRAPDAEGHAYWTAQLQSGAIERAELVGTFIAAALADDARDHDYLSNRTDVAVAFAQWENSNPQVLPTLQYDAAEILVGVNEDEATVTHALTHLESETSHIGETFTLTPGIDTLEGTVRDDTFNAFSVNPATGNSQTTLNAFDTIDGDEGFDTFNIYTDWGVNQAQQGTITNIEVVNVFAGNGATLYTADASAYQGVQEFWQIDGATDVTGAGSGVTVGFDNITLWAGESPVDAEERIVDVVVTSGSGLGTTRSVTIDGQAYQGYSLLGGGNAAMNDLVDAINANSAETGIVAVRTGGTTGLQLTAADGNQFQVTGASSVDVEEEGRPYNPGYAADQLSVDFTGTQGNIALERFETQEGEIDASLNARGRSLTEVNIEGNLARDSELLLNVRAGVNVQTVTLNSAVDTVLLNVDNHAPNSGTHLKVNAVDASGSTGDFSYSVDAGVKTVLAGSGDDIIVFDKAGARLDTFSTIDGGEGYDTVVLNLERFESQDYNAINQMTNIDALGFIGEDVVLDAGKVSDFKTLVFGSFEGDTEHDVEMSNLAADQLVMIGDGDEAFVTLLNAAANVSFDVGENAWLDLFVGTFNDDAGRWEKVGATGGTLSLSGEGDVDYINEQGKFSVIDASELKGSLDLYGMKSDLSETVILGSGKDWVSVDILVGADSSSTKGAMDMLQGFNSNVANNANDVVFLDAGEDRLNADGAATKVSVAKAGTLNQAFQLAAEAAADGALVFFQFDGDTYLYANTVDEGQTRYDDGDFALLVEGVHDFSNAQLFDFAFI